MPMYRGDVSNCKVNERRENKGIHTILQKVTNVHNEINRNYRKLVVFQMNKAKKIFSGNIRPNLGTNKL